MKNILKSTWGVTIASFGIACVANSDLGAFALTAAGKAVTHWSGIPFAISYLLLELSMLAWATYKGEGIGWTALINGIYGSLMVAMFHEILPHHWILFIGGFVIPYGYGVMGKAGLGETGSCLFTTVLMKLTGWNIIVCRTLLDSCLVLIGFIGARQYVTLFTVFLTLMTGPGLHFIYKLVNYKPTKIEHKYLISKKI